MTENSVVRASKILETAVSVASSDAKSWAKSILARNVDSEWFAEVENLRRHMLAAGLVDDTLFWRTPIPVPPPPQARTVMRITRMGADPVATTTTDWAKLLMAAAVGALILYFWLNRKKSVKRNPKRATRRRRRIAKKNDGEENAVL